VASGLVNVGSHQLAVEDSGTGPAVLMLHGLGGTTSVFQVLAEAFSTTHRIVRVDFCGAGRSPVGPDITVARHAEDAIAILDVLGIASANIVAHSMGTVVARLVAMRKPDAVQGLALLAPTRTPVPSVAQQRHLERASRLRSGGTPAIVDEVLRDAIGPTTLTRHPVRAAFVRELVLRQDPEGFARNYEAASTADDPGALPANIPVLLVGGAEDQLGSADIAVALQTTSSVARAATAPESGHSIPIEAADYTIALLRDFLSMDS
jgi:3-oxoadipate enol-lactonase